MERVTAQGKSTRVIGKALSRREFLGRLALTSVGVVALGAGVDRAASAHTGAANHGGYPDALIHDSMDDLKEFTTWLGTNKGYIGEVGFPSNLGRKRSPFAPDERQWARLGEAWYAHADAKGLWVTAQEASEQYYDLSTGGYYASVYLSPGDDVHKIINRPGFQAALVERHARPGRGVNFSGGQKFDESLMSNANPGIYDRDHWYPTTGSNSKDPRTGMNSFQYLASRGLTIVRVGFRWERMQPTINGPLSTTELARYKRAVANARAAGLGVVVDLHNYGGYVTSSGRKGLNTAALPTSAFVDVWRKLSAALAAEPGVIAYDLMNEPYNHGGVAAGSFGSPQKAWEAITQRCVNAIRARGDRTRIMVPTYGNVSKAADKHPKPWIVNGGAFMYTAHQYFDHYNPSNDGGGGDYPVSYQDENAYYASRGY